MKKQQWVYLLYCLSVFVYSLPLSCLATGDDHRPPDKLPHVIVPPNTNGGYQPMTGFKVISPTPSIPPAQIDNNDGLNVTAPGGSSTSGLTVTPPPVPPPSTPPAQIDNNDDLNITVPGP